MNLETKKLMEQHESIKSQIIEKQESCRKIINEIKEINSTKNRSLTDKNFELANELAVAGHGNEARQLHAIHNKLSNNF